MARPTKCTPELTAAICAELEQGVPMETAANANGVADSSLYEWLDKGLRDLEPYAAFTDAVTRARASGRLKLLKRVMQGDVGGGFGEAKAAAWVLEKTDRQRFGAERNRQEDEAVRRVLGVVRGICSPTDFERICTRLDALDSERGPGVPAGDSAESTLQ